MGNDYVTYVPRSGYCSSHSAAASVCCSAGLEAHALRQKPHPITSNAEQWRIACELTTEQCSAVLEEESHVARQFEPCGEPVCTVSHGK